MGTYESAAFQAMNDHRLWEAQDILRQAVGKGAQETSRAAIGEQVEIIDENIAGAFPHQRTAKVIG